MVGLIAACPEKKLFCPPSKTGLWRIWGIKPISPSVAERGQITSDFVESGTNDTGPGETPFGDGLWKSSNDLLPYFEISSLVAAPLVLQKLIMLVMKLTETYIRKYITIPQNYSRKSSIKSPIQLNKDNSRCNQINTILTTLKDAQQLVQLE